MSFEAEQIVLSLILKDNNNFVKIKDYLQPSDFIENTHKQIYKACIKIHERQEEINFITLNNYFTNKKINISPAYLIELAEVPILENILEAARQIKERTIKYRILNKLRSFIANLEKNLDVRLENISFTEIFKEIQTETKEAMINTWSKAEDVGEEEDCKIEEFFPLNVKVQAGTIWGIAGATSAGKTELALDIANVFCFHPETVVFYAQYEGTKRDFEVRLRRKKIRHNNFYYSIKPSFFEYIDFTESFKNKHIFIVVDYLQMFARRLQSQDKRSSDQLRKYVNKIFQFFDDLRVQYENISVCLLCSLSKAGISAVNKEKDKRLLILNAIKESGDVQYDLDYCYGVFFTDDFKTASLSRLNQQTGLSRKYLLLSVVKTNRTGERIKDVLLRYDKEKGQYVLKDGY